MSGPYFDTWKHQTLVRFAKEAYEKLQRQEEELQRLRLLTREAALDRMSNNARELGLDYENDR